MSTAPSPEKKITIAKHEGASAAHWNNFLLCAVVLAALGGVLLLSTGFAGTLIPSLALSGNLAAHFANMTPYVLGAMGGFGFFALRSLFGVEYNNIHPNRA